MSDKIPVNGSGQSYSGQILGTDENGFVRKIVVDETGKILTSNGSSSSEPTVIIDIAHDKAHRGEAFAINITDLTPTASGVVNCVITANVKDVHLKILGLANAGGLFRTFANPTFTGGTPYLPFNRVIGSTTSNATVVEGVTSLSGDTRGDLPILGSSGFFSTSGSEQSGGGFESILKVGDSLGIEVETNSAGQPIAIIVDFYEVEVV